MKKFICIIILLTSMATMYYFSSQDGEKSSMQSSAAVSVVDKIVNKVREEITLTDDRLIHIKDSILAELRNYNKEYLVRKAAHFGMYALIGGFMMLLIYQFSKEVILSGSISFILTFIYAVYDENRQLTVSGRNGCITDVFIDSSGALTAIIILSLILLTGKGIGFIFGKKTEE